jgi:manganese transport protein
MGKFSISLFIKTLAWLSALIIVGLNVKLVIDTLYDWHESLAAHIWIFNFIVLPVVALAMILFGYILWSAVLGKRFVREAKIPHGKAVDIPLIGRKHYEKIAICIDFSSGDIRAITEGVSLGDETTDFYLLHIVETAGARTLGEEIQDYETNEDWKQLRLYGNKLREQGYHVHEKLGFGDPKNEIPRISESIDAKLLVIGQHGHRGIKDIIFGETIAAVRHQAKCPVLVV